MTIFDEFKQYADVHPNIILKTDLARLGINVNPRATKRFQELDDIAWKGYHMFSFDGQDTKVMSNKRLFTAETSSADNQQPSTLDRS